MGLILNIDGGARGNPGPAGAGVVLRDEAGALLHESSWYLGRQTNNAAEYHALIRGLQRAARCAPQPVTVYSDSELLVRQLTGEYQVKSPGLAPLFREAQVLLLKLQRWNIRHVRREQNSRADELANLAMDRQADVLVFDADEPGQSPSARPAPSQPAGARPARPQSAAAPAGRGADVDDPDPELDEISANDEADSAAGESPAPVAHAPLPAHAPAVRVVVSRPPKAHACPAGCFADGAPFTITQVLPAGLCVHAAYALIPTALAMLNADPDEFAAVPTLSVRCTRAECAAEFQLSPVRGQNGKAAR
jgi:ribonuclease HI